MRRKLLGATLLMAMVFAPAQTALAHGGNGGASSDYRIDVTGFEGDASGVEVRPVELGNRMELVRTTAKEVQILGYTGEPYLRLDADGVFENLNSPAHYLNIDRFARQQQMPATASATAPPNWVKISSGNTIRWHDHRTHWMDPTPRQDVRDNPGIQRLINTDRVQLVVDGRAVAAVVTVTWLPPPPRTAWLLISSLAACALLAALVLVPSLRRHTPALATLATAASVVGSSMGTFRVIVSVVALVVAIAGWVLHNRWLPGVAALVVLVLSVTHFEVFEHRLLAGWAPEILQRLAITIALACAAAVVGSEVVKGLAATPQSEPATATT